jgi:hypothetical protein
MKASTKPSPKEKSASQQIDAIIKETADWRGKKLSQLRAVIKKADSAAVEEVKWKNLPDQRASPCGLLLESSAQPIRSRTPRG